MWQGNLTNGMMPNQRLGTITTMTTYEDMLPNGVVTVEVTEVTEVTVLD